jgi:hypothetical protein
MRLRSPALAAFMVKEFRHILRDRQTLVILLLLPLAQVVVFGFALRTDVHDIRIAFVDPAPDHATAALQGRFAGNGEFDVVGTVPRPACCSSVTHRIPTPAAGGTPTLAPSSPITATSSAPPPACGSKPSLACASTPRSRA